MNKRDMGHIRPSQQTGENETSFNSLTHEASKDCYASQTKPIDKQLTVTCISENKDHVKGIS